VKCECGNDATDDDGLCDYCRRIQDEPPHEGHYPPLGGGWFCDTCNSPYCELL
jgi:hypothetical protein